MCALIGGAIRTLGALWRWLQEDPDEWLVEDPLAS